MNNEETQSVVEKYDKMPDEKFEKLISILQRKSAEAKERLKLANTKKEQFYSRIREEWMSKTKAN